MIVKTMMMAALVVLAMTTESTARSVSEKDGGFWDHIVCLLEAGGGIGMTEENVLKFRACVKKREGR